LFVVEGFREEDGIGVEDEDGYSYEGSVKDEYGTADSGPSIFDVFVTVTSAGTLINVI
jgi:hypothetical protein